MPSDKERMIIQAIRAGGSERVRAENKLWVMFKDFIKWGRRDLNLSEDEARHAYNDCIRSVIDNIVKGADDKVQGGYKEDPNVLLKTYAERIFRNKCIDRLNALKGFPKTDDPDSLIAVLPSRAKDPIEVIIAKENTEKLHRCLLNLGDICREILKLFGGDYKDKEIAEIMNYSSAEVVKQSRYRCMDKLKECFAKTNTDE